MLSFLYAGTDGTIRGQIKDIDGEPLPGAQVFIQEMSLGAVADINGNYLILNIPVGTYDVTVMQCIVISLFLKTRETSKNSHIQFSKTI